MTDTDEALEREIHAALIAGDTAKADALFLRQLGLEDEPAGKSRAYAYARERAVPQEEVQ